MNSASMIRQYSTIMVTLAVGLFFPQYSAGVEIVPYVNSAHADTVTGVNRLSGYVTGNCAHCHEQHVSIGGAEPTPPVATGPSPQLLFDSLANNAACTFCHDATPGADNISAQMSKAYAHAPGSLIYSAVFGPDTLSCDKCHDPHYAQNFTHAEADDGNKIFTTGPVQIFSGALLSMVGVRTNNSWTAGALVAGAEDMGSVTLQTTVADDHIDKEYELCFKCHAGQLDGAPATNLDIHLQLNPNHNAVHPVATELHNWKNAYLSGTPTAFTLGSPWRNAAAVNKDMYCSDCHGSDNPADPKGPHGSNNIYMLKATGPGLSIDNLCTRCHDVSNSNWNNGLLDHDNPNHQQGIVNPSGCVACHGGDLGNPLRVSNIHGANFRWPDAGGGTGRLSYTFLVSNLITENYYLGLPAQEFVQGERRCNATCHSGGAHPY